MASLRSRWPSSAEARISSPTAAPCPSAPARARWLARVRPRPSRCRSIPPAGMPSIAGRRTGCRCAAARPLTSTFLHRSVRTAPCSTPTAAGTTSPPTATSGIPHVVSGWRPYYHGRWRFYARFGWTWVGGDVWAWPTHHYGRWGTTSAGAWFWVPGRTWGPAWVHWAVAPGYVSWCPLGFDGRPVVPFGYAHASRAVLQAGSVDSMDRRAPRSLRRVRVGQARSGGRPPLHARVACARSSLQTTRAGTAVRGAPIRRLHPQHAPALRRLAGARAARAVWRCLQAPANAPGKRQQPAMSSRDVAIQQPARRSGRPRFGEAPRTPPAAEAGRPAPSRRSTEVRAAREPASRWTLRQRRAPPRPRSDDAAPARGTAATRSARPAWNPDSVPVYRGGSLTSPV